MGLLPKEGNFLTLKVVNELVSSLGFSEKELKEYELVQVGDQVKWKPSATFKEKEIAIGERATDIIIEQLKKLDEDKKLKPEHMRLYEKFIERKED